MILVPAVLRITAMLWMHTKQNLWSRSFVFLDFFPPSYKIVGVSLSPRLYSVDLKKIASLSILLLHLSPFYGLHYAFFFFFTSQK